MATDLSKLRGNPLRDYSGVLLRQGAVVLDSDANEAAAIVDRRFRALASDVLGRATVSQTTPKAFEITAPNGRLLIGTGRYYVDGNLVENHGQTNPARRRFDPLLGEPAFEDAIDYAEQPYFPDAPDLPGDGTHIVYLDVWQREVTHTQQPDLVESAVGVETSSRIQTVWQVRWLANPRGLSLTCGSEPQEWLEVIAPSTGVLSTGTFDVPDVDDPCELPPTGGYRGLENQLYRVEIHDAGLPGQGATFKFSRENASVETAVVSVVHAKEIELTSLGRDDVLGFSIGDWVEVTNEAREFARRPGEIRTIIGIHPDSRRIALNEDLPSDLALGSTNPSKGLLARRWDQKRPIRQVGPSETLLPFHDLDDPSATPGVIPGVIPVPPPNTTLLLEDGVTLTFDDTGSTGFKAGDYWVFAARTGNASIERLDRAPPLGVHHHFARLAIWDAGARRVTDDCRVQWPPSGAQAQPAHDCSCTVCVTPEGGVTIQAAVNKVKETGGTVCLAPGRYLLEQPIHIADARSVRIRGASRGRLAVPGSGTVLEGPGGVFLIAASEAVEIQDLFLKSTNVAVSIMSSGNVVLERLAIDTEGQAVQLSGELPNLTIRQNELRGKIGIGGEGVSHRDDLPLPESRHESSLTFEDNWIVYQSVGLHLASVAASGDTIIARNKLQGAGKAIQVENKSEGSNSSTTISENHLEVSGEGAIESNAKTLAIRGNHVVVAGQGGPGIFVNGEGECLFADNFVEVKGPLAAVQLKTNVAIVNANRVKSPREAVAIDVSTASQATILGNVTSGIIKPPPNPTPTAWDGFNATAF